MKWAETIAPANIMKIETIDRSGAPAASLCSLIGLFFYSSYSSCADSRPLYPIIGSLVFGNLFIGFDSP